MIEYTKSDELLVKNKAQPLCTSDAHNLRTAIGILLNVDHAQKMQKENNSICHFV